MNGAQHMMNNELSSRLDAYLVSTAPRFSSFSKVQHMLLAIHCEVMACNAELCALVVVIPMSCTMQCSFVRKAQDAYVVQHCI